jgi:tubulin delta
MVLGNIFLNVGQCGNQVGRSFLTSLNDYHSKNSDFIGGSQYMNPSNYTNAILIDTEPKVIRHILENQQKNFKVHKDQTFYFNYGRGNNWAMSYSTVDHFDDLNSHFCHLNKRQRSLKHAGIIEENSAIIDATIERARKFLERLDYFRNFNLIFGIAGGTGSGLSSRLLEVLKDNFHDCQINSFVVFPRDKGELPLQYYNSLLT